MKNIRIQALHDMLKEGMIPADIGTDHAFLPLLALESGKAQKFYACDIAKGPLEGAAKNIREAGYTDQITCILCDGIAKVPEDTDAIIIAGMGWMTARHILEEGLDRLCHMKQILVEVNRDTVSLRRWISDHHFTIDDEKVVFDRGHSYEIVSFTTAVHDSYSEEEILMGPILLERRDEDFLLYAQQQCERIRKLLCYRKSEQERAVLEEQLERWSEV